MSKVNVPKFGNWEGDTAVPYTVYFENARKGKASGRRMNPNDPEDNPEIFKALADTLDSHNMPDPEHGVQGDKSIMDHPKPHHRSRLAELGYKKGSKGSYSSFSSSISSGLPKPQTDQNPPSTNLTQQPKHCRAASIPKFGAWDATDPTSGEGFTVIFNKVKQEKRVRTINLPASLPQPLNKLKNNKEKSKCRSSIASRVPKFLKINWCFFR